MPRPDPALEGLVAAIRAADPAPRAVGARLRRALGDRVSASAVRLAVAGLLRALPPGEGWPEERIRAFVAGSRAFRTLRLAAAAGTRERFLVHPEMGRRALPGDPVPALPTVGDLAAFLGWRPEVLDGHADLAGRHAREPRFRDYRYLWLGGRLIEAPKDRLRRAQRRLLREVLAAVRPHPAAHGFVAGRSAITHAACHTGQRMVAKLDLRRCFASIPARRVRGVFAALGYPPAVARVLTALTTTATPPDITAELPWAAAHLPQGAPTSPALANLVLHGLDARLAGLARRFGATYTRYADDLVFSGGDTSARLLARAASVVRDEGFEPHPDKTRLMSRSQQQRVCGLVVNVHVAVPRAARDRLRAEVHRRSDPAAPRSDAVLRGRIAWVRHARPAHAARLRDVAG